MPQIKTYIILFMLIVSITSHAQSRKISLSAQNAPIKEVLAEIQQKSGYRILYNDEVVADKIQVNGSFRNISVKEILENALKNTGLGYVMNGTELIIVTKEEYLLNTSDIFGKVTDEKGEPLAFANVLIFSQQDTAKMIQGAAADLQGNYQLLRVKHGTYWLQTSYLGYQIQKEKINVSDNKTLNYQLKPDAKTLKTIMVQGQEVRVAADKTTYQILKTDLAGKRNAMDLVEKIPQLQIDQINDKIINTNGKSVKLLLNGANATAIDLKSVRPENVLRFEYYDIPPARYAEYGSVVNVITKIPEDGIAAGVSLAHAFTTGFGNDQLYFKYNKGRHQISLDYALYHRNYKRREQEGTYDYTFKTNHYRREELLKNKFGYDDNYINLTYSNQKADDYAFQVKLSPNYMYYHNDGNSEVNYFVNNAQTKRTGTNTSRQSVFSPSVDVYFWKQLPNKQEVAVNLVGTGFATSNKYTNKEFNEKEESVLNDEMNEQNRKYSLIGELNYAKEFTAGKLNVGYSIETNKMKTTIENSFDDTDYSTSFLQNYAYTEFSGQKNKWLYQASLGASYRNRRSFNRQLTGWVFRPAAMIGHSFNAANSLKLSFERVNQEPSLASLSNNKVFITNEIIRQGNPLLRNSIKNTLSLNYNLNIKYLNLSVYPFFEYVTMPQNSYFIAQSDYIVRASENGNYSKTYGLWYSANIKPFGSNLLQLRVGGQIYNKELESSQIGHYSHVTNTGRYSIVFQKNNFTASYGINLVGYYLNGPYLTSDENNSQFWVRYKKDNWAIQAGVYWVGTLSKYHTYTIPESIVQYDFRTKIYDNSSMIVLGFSYDLTQGKKYNEKQKTLQNSDRDSGVF